MPLYSRAIFENRRGTLYIESGKTEFCGVIFNNACEAISLLKIIRGENIVNTFHHRNFKGYEIESGYILCINDDLKVLAYGSRRTAKLSINKLKERNII